MVDEEHSVIGPMVSPQIEAQVHRLCESIVKHVPRITNSCHTVRHMSLYLKLDGNNKLWFMYFSAMRTSTSNFNYGIPAKWIDFQLVYKMLSDASENSNGTRNKGKMAANTSPSKVNNGMLMGREHVDITCPNCESTCSTYE